MPKAKTTKPGIKGKGNISADAIGGKTFRYKKPPAPGRTKCPRKKCKGLVVMHPARRKVQEHFTCTKCNWTTLPPD